MPNVQIQISNECQIPKKQFYDLNFELDLTFELCHLEFKL
jgi:hypothetical protein